MGKKAKWFGAVKKVFSPESKEKKSKEKKAENNHKTNKLSGVGKYKDSDPSSSESYETNCAQNSAPPPPPQARAVGVKLAEVETEQSRHAYSVAMASSAASVPAVSSAQAAKASAAVRFGGKSKEEIAAIRIQTAFRGYLARRALRALRGLVRLKSLIHGNACKRQATTTLRCMQTLARVQSQIRSRRIRMSEENQALQRQLLLKREKELESLRMGGEWDDSLQSKEQIEASLQSKQEAAVRRERALAYAFTHQGRNSSRSANPMFMDPNNPQWGWSWLERWMAARPWESRSTTDKDLNSDRASVKSSALSVNGGEITKAYARRNSPSTPKSKPPTSLVKMNSASPKMSWAPPDEDTRSMLSLKSEKPRRHSIAGSSAGDDESFASSPAVPSYMAPTQSARARSRFSSPSNDVVIEGLDKVSVGSVKKKLSFPTGSGVPRRHSGPPKVDMSTIKDVAVQSESNGGSR
ncbi:uncharacterized protein A4U43_C07F3880 [Asparagus officinalis]|uniref:DUF4005 domain-containing protein n=1 Tax=Asparagus officinalis TaxID=4686 RepID=A0A5P1EEE7_ASPOF|nr:protein IQ-DOMAIN 1-like [Asparagus officinalis]XP_020273586.1 protein IQ-DOMAIN 1-like [Asparagus officinalis]XP_020273587.1 protein IQ-DOMAIN 1-like [Asparagus officinalis]ONK62440.1 uncharacterized protein A4U43_C07F3880 [Asparagus officinalis]